MRTALVVAVGVTVIASVAAVTAVDRSGPVGRARVPAVRGTAVVVDPDDGGSLRFGGTGTDDVDRVKVALTSRSRVNVGGDMTVEFFVKGRRQDNAGAGCVAGDAGWITGNVVIDRDVYGPGDRGDFGISLASGRVAFGVSRGSDGATACGATDVLDGAWHHVAATRRAVDGRLRVFVDGRLDAEVSSSGATGDISYRVGRGSEWPGSDPFLVVGAEKHDAGAGYPSFAGWVDEIRISTVERYSGPFDVPGGPFVVDDATAALYHLDDTGSTALDAVGTSTGEIRRAAPGGLPISSPDEPW